MIFFQNQQSSAPIGQNSSIINIPIYFLFNEQGFIIDLEQLKTCFSTDSFENSVVNQFINLIDQNSLEDPLIISLLKNEVAFLKSLFIHSVNDLLINLLTNMPIDTLVSLLTNLPIYELQGLFNFGRLKFVIDFSRIHCEIDWNGRNCLKLSKNLRKNLFVNFPENIKKKLVINPQLKEMWSKEDQNLNSSEFSKIVTPSKPSLDLLLKSIEKDQTEQSQKFFSEKQKKIIILCDLTVGVNLMKKLFGNNLDKGEIYYESKNLSHLGLNSIECLCNDKYNVEILDTSEFKRGFYIQRGVDVRFLWRYIINNDTDNFDIALIIFELRDFCVLGSQIFKWLFFLKTFKSQNIKVIIAFIRENPFNNMQEEKKLVELAKNRIEKMIHILRLEEIEIEILEKLFIYRNEKHMAELSSKIDRCIANEDTQNRS
jgi:hypothetical protein